MRAGELWMGSAAALGFGISAGDPSERVVRARQTTFAGHRELATIPASQKRLYRPEYKQLHENGCYENMAARSPAPPAKPQLARLPTRNSSAFVPAVDSSDSRFASADISGNRTIPLAAMSAATT